MCQILQEFLRLNTQCIWWMPRHGELTKDVAACDKPRGGGKQPLIRGCPNGETQSREAGLSVTEFIGN